MGDLGDKISLMYGLGVHLSAPLELRLERVKQRSYGLYGERVCKAGDMYEQELKFFNFVASRSLSKIDEWAQTLTSPVVCIDGTVDWRLNAANVAKQYLNIK